MRVFAAASIASDAVFASASIAADAVFAAASIAADAVFASASIAADAGVCFCFYVTDLREVVGSVCSRPYPRGKSSGQTPRRGIPPLPPVFIKKESRVAASL